MSSNLYLDNEDLRFQLERAFDFSEIVALFERGYSVPEGFRDEQEAREFYRDILENVGKFLATEVLPAARRNDETGPRLEDGEVVVPEGLRQIFDGFRDMGLYALNLPRELGGLNAPMVTYFVIAELLGRADISLVGHYGFHGGIAMSLLLYALEEGSVEHTKGTLLKTRFDQAIAEIATGEAFGCMVLTEPDAGSDLGAIRTRGVLGPDGIWRLSGQKIFITSGHGQHQLVLAKTEDTGNGLKDLSLFWVPRIIERDGKTIKNVQIERLEEKLGIHASVTCTLAYDESIAELIGKRGQGFELMLLLMNNARLGVSFEAIGLIECACRLAREFAAERQSMGKTIDRHEMIADYLEQMELDVVGLRAMAFDTAQAMELFSRLSTQLKLDPPASDEERKAMERRIRRLKRRARDLTPLLKYLASEKAVSISQKSLQIHGGVGYTKDYLPEKLVRDALVLPIYEGTSQIQALMALKDQLGGVLKDPGAFLKRVAQARLTALSARDPLDRQFAHLESLVLSAMQKILTRMAMGKLRSVEHPSLAELKRAFKTWDPKRDFSFGLLHAERFCHMLAELEVCRILVDQGHRFPERRDIAERYLEKTRPLIACLNDQIHHTGEGLLKRLSEKQTAE